MLRRIILFLLIISPIHLFSQLNYVRGYIIYNDGTRDSCLLLNSGIENKGEDYVFKLLENDDPQVMDVGKIKEFGVEGTIKFISEFIAVDVSNNQIKVIGDTLDHANIEYGNAFLLQLIDSKEASLYYFYYKGKEYFFYSVDDSGIHLLVYKKYFVNVATRIVTDILIDDRYKEQLATYLPCSVNTKLLSYSRKSLIKYFEIYIKEKGGYASVTGVSTKAKLNFKIAGTLNQSSFYIKDGDMLGYDFGKKNTFSYGAELEFLLPFNRNAFGFFTELNYLKYFSTYSDNTPNSETVITYSFIEFPIGIVYNFNFSEKLKFFFKGAFVANLILDESSVSFYRPSNSYDVHSSGYVFIGGGISYSVFSAEARIYSRRDITQDLYLRGSVYEQFSIRIAYRIF